MGQGVCCGSGIGSFEDVVNTTLAYSNGVTSLLWDYVGLIVGDEEGVAVVCSAAAYQHGCWTPHHAIRLHGKSTQ